MNEPILHVVPLDKIQDRSDIFGLFVRVPLQEIMATSRHPVRAGSFTLTGDDSLLLMSPTNSKCVIDVTNVVGQRYSRLLMIVSHKTSSDSEMWMLDNVWGKNNQRLCWSRTQGPRGLSPRAPRGPRRSGGRSPSAAGRQVPVATDAMKDKRLRKRTCFHFIPSLDIMGSYVENTRPRVL